MIHILRQNIKPARLYYDSVQWLIANVGPERDFAFTSVQQEADIETDYEREFLEHFVMPPMHYISTFSYGVGDEWRCIFARVDLMYGNTNSHKDHLLVSIEDELLATQYRLTF
jgi:hypothetical protein